MRLPYAESVDIHTMSTLPPTALLAAQCACGCAYTAYEWPFLRRLGRRVASNGTWLEIRECECGGNVEAELEAEVGR